MLISPSSEINQKKYEQTNFRCLILKRVLFCFLLFFGSGLSIFTRDLVSIPEHNVFQNLTNSLTNETLTVNELFS